MKTLAIVTFEVDWENKYDMHGEPNMVDAIRDHLTPNDVTEFGYEWDMENAVGYIEGKLKILDIDTINLIKPEIKPLPFCEHCGEGHEEFGCEFSDGGTLWCLECYLSNKNDPKGYLYDYYNDMVKKGHIYYLEKKLKKLKENG